MGHPWAIHGPMATHGSPMDHLWVANEPPIGLPSVFSASPWIADGSTIGYPLSIGIMFLAAAFGLLGSYVRSSSDHGSRMGLEGRPMVHRPWVAHGSPMSHARVSDRIVILAHGSPIDNQLVTPWVVRVARRAAVDFHGAPLNCTCKPRNSTYKQA